MVGVGSCDISGYVIAEHPAVAVSGPAVVDVCGARRGRRAVRGHRGDRIGVGAVGRAARPRGRHRRAGRPALTNRRHRQGGRTDRDQGRDHVRDGPRARCRRMDRHGGARIERDHVGQGRPRLPAAEGHRVGTRSRADAHAHLCGDASRGPERAVRRAGGRVYRIIGDRGRARPAAVQSADGPAGRRTIYAIVSEDGVARREARGRPLRGTGVGDSGPGHGACMSGRAAAASRSASARPRRPTTTWCGSSPPTGAGCSG